MSAVPSNKVLYNKIKAESKKKFDVWPSAWLVKTYKKRGGTYGGSKSVVKKVSKRHLAKNQGVDHLVNLKVECVKSVTVNKSCYNVLNL